MKVQPEEHWQLTRPFSLFTLAASLEKNTEFEVDIVDLEAIEQRSSTKVSLEKTFKDDNALIFGITATTQTRSEAIRTAKVIKRLHPQALIIVGGVHFMHCDKDTLNNVPEVDVVVRGEGEETLVELAHAIERRTSYEKIKGITYRSESELIQNPDRNLITGLDDLPGYEKYSWDEYPEYLFGYPDRVPAISVMSSRGCPYQCVFCSKAGQQYRLKSPERAVDEIEILKDRFNIKGVNFLDLTLTASPRHVEALCTEMIERDIDVIWWCESRANIRLELLDMMKQAGCVSIALGVESGSPRIISSTKKAITIEQVVQFCERCRDLGIFVVPYFMFSLPGETEDDVRLSIDLIEKLERITQPCSFQPTMIFPGTTVERLAREQHILPDDFSWCDPYYSKLNIELDQFPNIPLFIDKIPPHKLKELMHEKRIRVGAKRVSEMSFKEIFKTAYRMLTQRRPISPYISPQFLRRFLSAKFKQNSKS